MEVQTVITRAALPVQSDLKPLVSVDEPFLPNNPSDLYLLNGVGPSTLESVSQSEISHLSLLQNIALSISSAFASPGSSGYLTLDTFTNRLFSHGGLISSLIREFGLYLQSNLAGLANSLSLQSLSRNFAELLMNQLQRTIPTPTGGWDNLLVSRDLYALRFASIPAPPPLMAGDSSFNTFALSTVLDSLSAISAAVGRSSGIRSGVELGNMSLRTMDPYPHSQTILDTVGRRFLSQPDRLQRAMPLDPRTIPYDDPRQASRDKVERFKFSRKLLELLQRLFLRVFPTANNSTDADS